MTSTNTGILNGFVVHGPTLSAFTSLDEWVTNKHWGLTINIWDFIGYLGSFVQNGSNGDGKKNKFQQKSNQAYLAFRYHKNVVINPTTAVFFAYPTALIIIYDVISKQSSWVCSPILSPH
jgi:hypothetical protein